jgi:hypothetical protein
MVVLACVVAVITIVFLATAPKPEPVKVWFVGYTNVYGHKHLVFAGTNGTPREIAVFSCVVTGEILQVRTTIPDARTLDRMLHDRFEARSGAAAGKGFDLTLPVPRKNVPYCVIWHVPDMDPMATRWGKLRWGCYNFFLDHHMPGLARRFVNCAELHYIPSSEIKE